MPASMRRSRRAIKFLAFSSSLLAMPSGAHCHSRRMLPLTSWHEYLADDAKLSVLLYFLCRHSCRFFTKCRHRSGVLLLLGCRTAEHFSITVARTLLRAVVSLLAVTA